MIHLAKPRLVLDRREFVKVAAAGTATLFAGTQLIACGVDPNGAEPRVAGPTGPNQGLLDPTCGELTAPNIEGPFFETGSPERAVLRDAGMDGVPLVIAGRVVAQGCTPIAGAALDFWQADDDGAYDNSGFTLRGHQFTDDQGLYRLETIVPGHYLNGANYRPAHIHVKVGATGFRVLTTQLYFEGDPYNDIDAFIRDSLIMPITTADDGVKVATFDFVLAPA